MEKLPPHESELDYRFTNGLEVQFIYDSITSIAYSRTIDHLTGEEFSSIAPEGVHPKRTFEHPFAYRVDNESQG